MCHSLPVERLTAEQMDEQRIQNVAYQYLCRLEEAKRSVHTRAHSSVYSSWCGIVLPPVLRWIEACLGEELPAPTELEEVLRNGVILAKLGHRFAPDAVSLKKIYDPEQHRYHVTHAHAHRSIIVLSLINNPLHPDVIRLWGFSSVTPTTSTTGGML